eukprot:957883-Rhodomonas_salina.1
MALSRWALPEVPTCPYCLVAYSEEREPQRFDCRQHDCCRDCVVQFVSFGIKQCPECRVAIGEPTTDRWLLRLVLFIRTAREAQRKRLDSGKPLTFEAKHFIEQAHAYLEKLFGDHGPAARGQIPLAHQIPTLPPLEDIECVTCWNTFSQENKPVRLTCNHCVCADCAAQWTNTCPKCRASYNPDEVEVDESLLAMAIFYPDLCATIEESKQHGVNCEIFNVLAELHACTKRALVNAAHAGPAPARGAAGSEEAFERELAMAMAASEAEWEGR